MPSPLSKKSRRLPKAFTSRGSLYVSEGDKFGPWSKKPTSSGFFRWDGFQFTETEGHSWPPPKGSFKDVGGPFKTIKTTAQVIGQPVSITSEKDNSQYFQYRGYLIPPGIPRVGGENTQPILCPTDIGLSSSQMNVKGAEAVSLCSPLNPISGAATFLSELVSEGLPALPGSSVWKETTRSWLGKSGNEFLNYEFGIAPTLEEILEFKDAITKAALTLRQFQRDSGKVVRRQFNFPTENSVSEETIQPNARAWYGNVNRPGFNIGLLGETVRIRNTSRKVAFSGAFTYHVPSGDDFFGRLGKIADDAQVLGVLPTPETLWELTPWSWAVDWFSDAQEVITNLQNMELYGLVMRYGYLMVETIVDDIYFMKGSSGLHCLQGDGVTYAPVPLNMVSTVSVKSTEKRRVHANPFGFGVEWADLSPTQLAIAAALGITRVL